MAAGSGRQRVVVVTGGAAGIGAAIAEELGRTGAYVVALDPVVSVDGSSQAAGVGPNTAQKIVDAGGAARASNTSVTDREAVEQLFAQLVREFGGLDAVVNVAGISRPTDFASGSEEDWAAVLAVHLDGYLNVLGAALPLMEAAGRGQILGVTSGSGWRPANTGAYGCAKRAVAALTWQIGRTTPQGVTVNALSPIAATRMVTAALPPAVTAAAGSGREGRDARTGGLGLGSMPPPEHLGPVGAYLAGEEFSWCQGQVIFSGGSELALIAPPRLLEVSRSRDVSSLPDALAAVVPKAFVTAEAAQATNGGGNPRFPGAFDAPGPETGEGSGAGTCVVVTDDPGWGVALGNALASQGVKCVGVGTASDDRLSSVDVAHGFEAAASQLSQAAHDSRCRRRSRGRAARCPPRHTPAIERRWLARGARRARRNRRVDPCRRRVGACGRRLLGRKRTTGPPGVAHRGHLLRRPKQGSGRGTAGAVGSHRDVGPCRRIRDQRRDRRRARAQARRRAGDAPRAQPRGRRPLGCGAGRGIGLAGAPESPETCCDDRLRRTGRSRLGRRRDAKRGRRRLVLTSAAQPQSSEDS